MISASDTIRSIDQATGKVRTDEMRVVGAIEAANAEATRLRGEQASLFRDLARLRLDSLSQETLKGGLDTAEREAMTLLETHNRQVAAIQQQHEALTKDLSALQLERARLADAVQEAAQRINVQRDATEKRLTDDLAWQAQSSKVEGARMRAQAAEAKAQQAEADREVKSKPYLADKLFSYLWNRGFATPVYRAGWFARWGDGYVARLIRYEPARQNFFMLNEVPKRLREHAERLKAQVADEEAQLRALERSALVADKIEALEAEHRDAVAALDAHDKKQSDLEQAIAATDKRRVALSEGEGSGLVRAQEVLAQSLKRDDLRTLMQEALATPTPDDERIIQRLQDIDTILDRLAREMAEARKAFVEIARKRVELERSREEFRQSGYERQGGGFSNEKLIGDILGGIIGGVLSSRDLGDALRSGYRQGKKRRGPPSDGGWGGGFGGGFGGGGSSGSSGDGFRTGGRF